MMEARALSLSNLIAIDSAITSLSQMIAIAPLKTAITTNP